MPTVLIGAGPIRNQPGRFRDLLVEAGFELIEPPGHDPLSIDQLLEYLPQVDAAVAGGEPHPGAVIDACPRLRVIARTGVGYDAVDLDACRRHRIAVTITPGTNHESVAEQTFALMLAVMRRIGINDRSIRAGGWDRTMPMPVRGKTLGIIGLGRTGLAMVPRAQGFGMRVLGYDPMPASEVERQHGVQRVSLDELLATSDVVSLHTPLVPETKHLICQATLARMKPGAILLNSARGGVVCETDLVEALESGRLAGAGLDVLDREPPDPRNPLLHLENVIVSPHLGGIDTRAMFDMAESAALSILSLHRGDWPEPCIVNPEIRPGWTW